MYRDVARTLSPTTTDRGVVSSIYNAVRTALPGTCFMTGSYARFTASRPLHDLDIFFVAGAFDPQHLDPRATLAALQSSIEANFRNPTALRTQVSAQTHSITIAFLSRDEERFAVDIVPAFTSGDLNEFEQPTFWVPEIATTSRRNRGARYIQLRESNKTERDWWVRSDPLGYIRLAADMNARNDDFRKVAKFIKKWKYSCGSQNREFLLKSFHVEQAVLTILGENPAFDIGGAIFRYFCTLPDSIEQPQIRDRADPTKFIDEYVRGLTPVQRETLKQARDFFLIKLEDASKDADVASLLNGGFHRRASHSEEYLFDSGIPVLVERDASLRVRGNVLARRGGFQPYVLDKAGLIEIDRQISFRAEFRGPYELDMYKWKVKNDNGSPEPRGDITDHTTKNDPENTKYSGSHFTECYAIKDSICIARARQNVVLKRA